MRITGDTFWPKVSANACRKTSRKRIARVVKETWGLCTEMCARASAHVCVCVSVSTRRACAKYADIFPCCECDKSVCLLAALPENCVRKLAAFSFSHAIAPSHYSYPILNSANRLGFYHRTTSEVISGWQAGGGADVWHVHGAGDVSFSMLFFRCH